MLLYTKTLNQDKVMKIPRRMLLIEKIYYNKILNLIENTRSFASLDGNWY